MAKRPPGANKKRAPRILGIRPWVFLIGGLSIAAVRAMAQAKHRRLASVDKPPAEVVDTPGHDSLPASDLPSRNMGEDSTK
jgi:hypothetical protein